MTGRLLFDSGRAPYTRAIFGGFDSFTLFDKDIRQFGSIEWGAAVPERISLLGPESFDVTPREFSESTRSRHVHVIDDRLDFRVDVRRKCKSFIFLPKLSSRLATSSRFVVIARLNAYDPGLPKFRPGSAPVRETKPAKPERQHACLILNRDRWPLRSAARRQPLNHRLRQLDETRGVRILVSVQNDGPSRIAADPHLRVQR